MNYAYSTTSNLSEHSIPPALSFSFNSSGQCVISRPAYNTSRILCDNRHVKHWEIDPRFAMIFNASVENLTIRGSAEIHNSKIEHLTVTNGNIILFNCWGFKEIDIKGVVLVINMHDIDRIKCNNMFVFKEALILDRTFDYETNRAQGEILEKLLIQSG